MARKTFEQTEQLKKQLNTSRLWSFSRVNCFLNCSYSYYLKYIKREKEYTTSIYSVLGSAFHDALENFYNGKIPYEQMLSDAENTILNTELSDMKFNSCDDEKNENIKVKYFECIKHFFQHHVKVDAKVLSEKDVMVKIGNHYFLGYIDAIHKDGDNYIITDYKSSTIYQGKKIIQEGRQLTLYALGLHQKGIPVENIKIRWNFLKYTAVTYTQKNGNPKTMNAERNTWVGKIKSSLRMFLKDMKTYTEEEIEGLLEQSMMLNSLDMMPKEIQSKYKIEDCYVEIPLSKESFDTLEKEFNTIIQNIYKLEAEHDKNKDESIFHRQVKQEHSYFCYNICGFTAGQCRCYKEFLESENMFKKEEGNLDKKEENQEDWMRELGLL